MSSKKKGFMEHALSGPTPDPIINGVSGMIMGGDDDDPNAKLDAEKAVLQQQLAKVDKEMADLGRQAFKQEVEGRIAKLGGDTGGAGALPRQTPAGSPVSLGSKPTQSASAPTTAMNKPGSGSATKV